MENTNKSACHSELAMRHSELDPASAKKRFRNKFGMTSIFAVFVICLASVFAFSSCADADGLHDQNSLLVTFVFKGFGDISGSYSIPGNFDDWDNTTADVTIKKGEGTSSAISVTTSNIQFTLVPVNGWTRDWYVAGSVEGNGSDSGAMRNFYIDGLDLNAGETTVLVDISSGTAVPVVQ